MQARTSGRGNRRQGPPKAPKPPGATPAWLPPGLSHGWNAARPLRRLWRNCPAAQSAYNRGSTPRTPQPSPHARVPPHTPSHIRTPPARPAPPQPSSHAVPTQDCPQTSSEGRVPPAAPRDPRPLTGGSRSCRQPRPRPRGGTHGARAALSGAFRARDWPAGRDGAKAPTAIGEG